MERQEIFDTVIGHLKNQGWERSMTGPSGSFYNHASGSTICAYRGDDGRKCAVGCLIPDEAYDVKMEGKSIYGLINGKPEYQLPEFVTSNSNLLASLQQLHDALKHLGLAERHKHINSIAKFYHLNTQPWMFDQ